MDEAVAFPAVSESDETNTGPRDQKKSSKSGGFQSMGLSQAIYKAIIRKGYRVPTPIQRKVVKLMISGRDIVAMARTGSGKTAAFLIPVLERLQHHSQKFGARAVILSPTRELAMQTQKFARELGTFTDLRSCLLIGGEKLEDQFSALADNVDIIIATPGRLMQHLTQTDLSLNMVSMCVFDEADRLFEMGFADQVKEILTRMPEARQTALFSATLPPGLAEFARAGLHEAALIRLDTDTKMSNSLKITFFTVRSEQKDGALLSVIREFMDPKKQQTVVFTATRYHVEFISAILKRAGFTVSMVYGNLDATARKINIAKFRAKKSSFLVVTDVAARGIDIPLLDNVINYDFPPTPKLFVHRVGRVGRAGREGTAYSFVAGNEIPYMIDVHLFLGRPLRNELSPAMLQDPTAVVYGSFADDSVEQECDRVRQWVRTDSWMSGQVKTLANAYKKYQKTRSRASPQSTKRWKQLPPIQIHPWLKDRMNVASIQRTQLVQQLRQFRPHTAVFKMSGNSTGVAGTLKRATAVPTQNAGEGAVSMVDGQPSVVEVDEGASTSGDLEGRTFSKPRSKVRKQRVRDTQRDDTFFIESLPANNFAEQSLRVRESDSGDKRSLIEDAVISLTADDAGDILKSRSVMKWDARRKRYVEGNSMAPTNTTRYRNEAGVVISSGGDQRGKKSAYVDWCERTNRRIPKAGTEEDRTASGPLQQSTGGRGRRGRHQAHASQGAKTESELKPKSQIRKERSTKKKRRDKMRQHGAKR